MKTRSAEHEAAVMAAIRRAIDLDDCGKTKEAIPILEELLSTFPTEPALYVYLSWYLRKLGQLDRAVAFGRRATELAPLSSRASLGAFHALWEAGLRADAIGEARRFIRVRRSTKETSHYDRILAQWDAGGRIGRID